MARHYDVLVCGGGPAGLGSALSAARSGMHTLLIEQHAMLGGLWTMGLLTPFFDVNNKHGLTREIHATMTDLGGQMVFRSDGIFMYHVGYLARLFDRLTTEAGCEVQLHTIVDEALVEDDRVVGVVAHSKSGREELRAKVVIDTTGDGDVAARAGCGFDVGRPEDGACQPATLFAMVCGAPEETVYPEEIMAAVHAAGGDLSYHHPYIFPQPGAPGVGIFMCNHIYRLDATDALAVSRAEIEARAQIVGALELLRRSGNPRLEQVRLVQFAGQIGIRESRRIHGLYTLTAEEAIGGARFDDGICEVTFNIDVHHYGGEQSAARSEQDGFRRRSWTDGSGKPSETDRGLDLHDVTPYEIPLRCLVPRDRDGLLVAGRCISGDHLAHASYRVTGDCAAMGEAAGVAAAMACQMQCRPAELDGVTVRNHLDEYYRTLNRGG